MIEASFSLGDEVVRFGNAHHGLALNPWYGSDKLLQVGNLLFPFPFEWEWNAGDIGREYFDTHLLRVPGVAPVDLPPEEVLSEAAAGRTWQDYALLSSNFMSLLGKNLMGWVCIDPAGVRWLISLTPGMYGSMVDPALPLQLQVSAVPFGYLDEQPVDPVTQSVTLADIGQSSGDAPPSSSSSGNLALWLCSVSSNGRRAVLELRGVQSPAFPETQRINTAPAGFLLLELVGPGPAFELSFTVLRTRLQCLGAWEEQRAGAKGVNPSILWTTTSTPRTVDGVSGADYICTAAGMAVTETPQVDGTPYVGSGWVGGKRSNRLMAIVFDEQDLMVELAFSVHYLCEYDYPEWAGTISGAVSGWLADSAPNTRTNVTNTVAGNYSRVSTETVRGEVALLRDGAEVSRGGFKHTRTVNESLTLDPSFAQDIYLQRDSGTVIGWGNRYLYQYDYAGTTECTGTSWTSESFSGPPGFVYNASIWYSFQSSPSIKPYTYNVSLSWGNNVADPYAGADAVLQRYSHCIMGIRERCRAGVNPHRWRVPHLVAPRAGWDNPDDQDETGGRRASYHPVTHEIYTTASDSDAAAFVWI
ncbi:hypothetical protein [Pseudomonas denitrificans (nom. rej.)]|uniref:Uncharacterized protein n=1 Tax=Pseudomonas denitrificans TaxID=43306 RepID=A0A9X7N1C4_PSEDE|nr:hypothetical protein [Pseudomonas denitrificans (nom. rej.)]QEY73216.1 hypothetical protein F1C79_17265 [Pseudomonas denitrificans (nom. rej.)]